MSSYYWKDKKIHNTDQRVNEISRVLNLNAVFKPLKITLNGDNSEFN